MWRVLSLNSERGVRVCSGPEVDRRVRQVREGATSHIALAGPVGREEDDSRDKMFAHEFVEELLVVPVARRKAAVLILHLGHNDWTAILIEKRLEKRQRYAKPASHVVQIGGIAAAKCDIGIIT